MLAMITILSLLHYFSITSRKVQMKDPKHITSITVRKSSSTVSVGMLHSIAFLVNCSMVDLHFSRHILDHKLRYFPQIETFLGHSGAPHLLCVVQKAATHTCRHRLRGSPFQFLHLGPFESCSNPQKANRFPSAKYGVYMLLMVFNGV